MRPSPFTLARAALAAVLVLAALPLSAAAHAELVSTVPSNGDTVIGPPERISATFDEALGANSAIELRDAAGTTLATGGVDAADPTTLSLVPPDLGDGSYEVRWTAVAEDGDITRGTFTFSVALPPTQLPTPTSAPSATPAATASQATPAATALTPSPTPAPSAAPTEPTAGTTDVLIPIVVAVVLLGGFGAWLLRRRSGGA
jgi:methionine-rich copper-binding protein CopC